MDAYRRKQPAHISINLVPHRKHICNMARAKGYVKRTAAAPLDLVQQTAAEYLHFKSGCLKRLMELRLEPHSVALKAAAEEIVGRVHREYPKCERTAEFWRELGYQLLVSEPELIDVVSNCTGKRANDESAPEVSGNGHDGLVVTRRTKKDKPSRKRSPCGKTLEQFQIPELATKDSVIAPLTPDRSRSIASQSSRSPSESGEDAPSDLHSELFEPSCQVAVTDCIPVQPVPSHPEPQGQGTAEPKDQASFDEFLLQEVQRLQKHNQDLMIKLQQMQAANSHLVEQIDYLESCQTDADEEDEDVELPCVEGEPHVYPAYVPLMEHYGISRLQHMVSYEQRKADYLQGLISSLKVAEARWRKLIFNDSVMVEMTLGETYGILGFR